jgi:hypothetical protein
MDGCMPKGFLQLHQAKCSELFPRYQTLFTVTLQTDVSFTLHQHTAKLRELLHIFSMHGWHDADARQMVVVVLVVVVVVVVMMMMMIIIIMAMVVMVIPDR